MNNKVYVVTEINYNDFCLDCDTLSDLKIFKNEKDALYYYYDKLMNYKNEFVIDENYDEYNIKVGDVVTFFYKEQDNWDAYFELSITEEELS